MAAIDKTGGDGATFGFNISPDDNADLPFVTRELFVGVTGNVRVRTVGGSDFTLAVPAGKRLPLRVTRVFATGTTAGNVVGLC
jgi:hypothetical protein